MMELRGKKLRRGQNLIVLAVLFVCLSCLLVLLLSILTLPEISLENGKWGLSDSSKDTKWISNEEDRLGELGKRMVSMLPDDLPFTIFVPSEAAFERDLNLRANDSLEQQTGNATAIILSRLLGFSAIPQQLSAGAVPLDGVASFDSVSGYSLDVTRVSQRTLVVNTIQSEQVDLSQGDIIIHIMSKVIMDAEFAETFLPD